EGDDLEGTLAFEGAVLAGELDCTLVGLGSAVCEEDLVEPAQFGQLGRKFNGNVIVVSRARRDQLARLMAYRLGDRRRRMAEAVDRPALHEIKIPSAVVVPEPRALTSDEDGRRPGGNFHKCMRGIAVEGHGRASRVKFEDTGAHHQWWWMTCLQSEMAD